MAEKKDCCNKGAALEALQWVLTNKKAWAVLLMIAKLAPQAIVRAVAEIRGPSPAGDIGWGCPQCHAYQSHAVKQCAHCGWPRPVLP
jgi:hypothetical protein